MRIAVLVKQVPTFEAMSLGPDGRLRRDGLDLEMNPYCRRAVAKGVELGRCTVFTLGPPAAEDVLREAIAWGADEGVLVTDPAFAGSDTLATARALAAALRREGPFDLVLAGRNSVDADTGQVGPQVAELLDLPFLTGVRHLALDGTRVSARCEHDDGYVVATTALPALLSCAERLCDPAKVPPEGRAAVAADRIRRLSAADLGPGPWGQAGSPTRVGRIEVLEVERTRIVLSGSPADQVEQAVAVLRDRGALTASDRTVAREQHSVLSTVRSSGGGPVVAVLVEPGRPRTARELLGAAAAVAPEIDGRVVAVTFDAGDDPGVLASFGADAVVRFDGVTVEDDVAAAVGPWVDAERPWAVLAPGTVWGREVSSRVAARVGAGLTGDAVDVAVDDGRLVGWKPAFGGALVAAITATTDVQMVTVRPGMLAPPAPRARADVPVEVRTATPRGRVRHIEAVRDDELDVLTLADAVVGVGTGVRPDEYDDLQPLLHALGAELGATRKVTDKGWQPRARQIGITGRSIGPRLYVAIGLAGKFNHMVGVRGAGCILAINTDPDALVFDAADVGIVADWREVVPLLADAVAGERVGS